MKKFKFYHYFDFRANQPVTARLELCYRSINLKVSKIINCKSYKKLLFIKISEEQ